MCQCYSSNLSLSLLPPLCPQVSSLCLHPRCCPANRLISTILLDFIYMHQCVKLFVPFWLTSLNIFICSQFSSKVGRSSGCPKPWWCPSWPRSTPFSAVPSRFPSSCSFLLFPAHLRTTPTCISIKLVPPGQSSVVCITRFKHLTLNSLALGHSHMTYGRLQR